MRRFILILLLLPLPSCGANGTPPLTDIVTKGQTVDARAFASLSTAKASPQTAGKRVVVTNNQTVNSFTWPADRGLEFIEGGKLTVNSGKTVQIPVPTAGRYQIFFGSGTVTFSGGGTVRAEWFQTLAAAAKAAAGRELLLEGGSYTANEVELYSGTTMTCRAGATITKSGGAAYSNMFNSSGVLGSAATLLTASVATGEDVVSITSAASLAVGQVVMISQDTYACSTHGRTQELNEIIAINGLAVTLKHPLKNSYTTSNNAALVPFATDKRDITVQGCRLVIPEGVSGGGLIFNQAYNIMVKDVEVSGMGDQAGITFWATGYSQVAGGYLHDGQDIEQPGRGYGFSAGESSHNILVTGLRTENVRENAAGTGCKHITFLSNTDIGAYDDSWNAHGSGNQYIDFIGNRSINSRKFGIVPTFENDAPDHHIRVIGNTIINSGASAIYAIAGASARSTDLEVRGNTIRNAVTSATHAAGGFAPVIISYFDGVIFADNIVDGESSAVHPDAPALFMHSTGVDVTGNRFQNYPGSWGVTHYGNTGFNFSGNTVANVQGGLLRGVVEGTIPSTGIQISRNTVDTNLFTAVGTELITDNNWNGGRGDSVDGVAGNIGTITVVPSVAGKFAAVTSAGKVLRVLSSFIAY